MKKFFTKEVKIALVAILAIIVLYGGLQFLKGMSLFSKGGSYYVRFTDVSGLSASSPVYANGYRVGVIKSIDYDYAHPGNIVAAMDIDPQMKLPEGTKAEIVSDLLGNVKLELRLAQGAQLLALGDTIDGGMQEGLMSRAAELLPEVEQMLPKLDSILANVQALTADPALAGTLHNAENITAQLTEASAQLTQLSKQLNQRLPVLMTKADSTLTNTERLTGNLAQMDLGATMSRVDRTLASVESIAAQLAQGKGTAGRLMLDAQLYEDLDATIRDVDSLLIDFKAHPRRYINVSVFGKKDK